MKRCSTRLIALASVVVVSMFGSVAADTLTYQFEGSLSEEPTSGVAVGDLTNLAGGSFSLSFVFDYAQLPDPERSGGGISYDSLETYVARDWNAIIRDREGSTLGNPDAESAPGVEALLQRFSRLDGPFDPGTSEFVPSLSGAGIDWFAVYERVGVFQSDVLEPAPGDSIFSNGSLTLGEGDSQVVFAVEDATLESIRGGGNINSQPVAVPSPGAAVGGLVLMVGIIGRRIRRHAIQRAG